MIVTDLKRYRTLFLTFVSGLAFFCVSAQNPLARSAKGKTDFWDKVRFGGGIGLGFTNGGFNTSISPSAIYQFNEQFAAGTALAFNYAKFGDARRTAYGGSLIALYNPIPFLQLSAELEQLRINERFDNGTVDLRENYWSPALFFGLGYTDRNFTIGIRYNVLYDDVRSIYASAWIPFVRVYF